MADMSRRRTAEYVLGAGGAVAALVGTLIGDPLNLGSTEVYWVPGTMAATSIAITDDLQGREALLATGGIVGGGLLLGIGTLPLSGPLAGPLSVAGTTVAEGGLVTVAGLLLFGYSIWWTLVRDS